ncbi:sulfotransferase [uncultured Alcanivorax sp.]|uniref:sulfotransferase domain-containing protein n=1 Tax=uncultured Alcanivorax sp. TaxID=191215 RepID=UPI002587C0C8|nr:sulfotransferase [uncultured Alcanivorax sp.]
MVKPNFFIVGAPKCGTTSVFNWLIQHPNVFIPDRKEIHYFNRDGMTRVDSIEEYESLFSSAGNEDFAIGDASTHYLFSSCAISNIVDYQPCAKIIVFVRNPIEMAPSLHSERVYQGMDALTCFSTAWRESDSRPSTLYKAGESINDPDRLNYKEYCLLGRQLEKVFAIVNPKNIHVVVFDDLISNPNGVFDGLIDFLELPCFDPSYGVANRNKSVRFSFVQIIMARLISLKRKLPFPSFGVANIINLLNVTERPREAVDPQIVNEMKDYYRKDVELLSELIGRDLNHWIKPE